MKTIVATLFALLMLGGVSASAEALPDAPKPHRFFDKTNMVLTATTAAAIAGDAWTTHSFIARGNKEMNPLARPFVHSNGMLALYFGSSQAAEIGGMYLLHKTRHHRWERVLPVVTTAVEGFWVVHNLRLRPTIPVVPPLPDGEVFRIR